MTLPEILAALRDLLAEVEAEAVGVHRLKCAEADRLHLWGKDGNGGYVAQMERHRRMAFNPGFFGDSDPCANQCQYLWPCADHAQADAGIRTIAAKWGIG